ncbi:MAG TPA: hypothetical protein VG497_03680 [Kribbella sp.]|nr:hypothetical protein [Kribbella sp.]
MPRPTLTDVKTYLGEAAARWSDPELQAALDVETQAQIEVCRIPTDPFTDVYPVTLGEALKRRVQRNLALRSLPLAVLQSDAQGGNMYLPGRDVEVRRLEAPYRKMVTA